MKRNSRRGQSPGGRKQRGRQPTAKPLWVAGSIAAALPAAAYGQIAVTPTTDANALVNALVSGNPGIQIVPGSVSYTGGANASGTFTGANFLPFANGVVLTTGDARTSGSPGPGEPPDAFVIPGPNNSAGAGTDNLAAGDAQLAALASVPGQPTPATFNASVLQFSFIPTSNKIQFQFVFGSEEYNEFVGSSFNDVFGFFLNGTNIALIPGTPDRISINSVHGAVNNGFGQFQPQNGQYFTDNTASSSSAFNQTQLDGLVGVATPLFATGDVTPGQVNTIKLAIADVTDQILDSAVFFPVQGFDVVPVPPGPPVPPVPPSPPSPPVPPVPPSPPAAVPLPSAVWMGLSTLGGLGAMSKFRRRRRSED